MQETNIPITTLLTFGLWSVTVTLVLIAWAVYPFSHDMALMVITCACIAGCGAGTVTVRGYLIRLARLVRVAGGIHQNERERLHSVHE